MVATEPQFCHQCGAELLDREYDGRTRRYCPGCERFFFRNAVPAVNVFVRDGDRLLVLREADQDSDWADAGRWVVPGGHSEYDEEPVDAAVRELAEETGIRADPSDLTLFDVGHSTYKGLHYNNIAYLLDYGDAEGELTPGPEAAELQFWTPQEVRESDRTRDIDRERLPLLFD